LIECGPGPPGYALDQDLKNLFLTEKIRSVRPVLPSHAGNRKKAWLLPAV